MRFNELLDVPETSRPLGMEVNAIGIGPALFLAELGTRERDRTPRSVSRDGESRTQMNGDVCGAR